MSSVGPAVVEPGHEGVRRVLVVSKTHLDVGFTDLAAAVRERYLTDFFPRAVAVGRELRALDGPERLCWTTGSWILHEALEAGGSALRADIEQAVEAGDLAWHALPFTTHTELADRSLLEHGLTISARLDDWFGRRTRAAKLTDVPGHTRGLVSVLASAGVDLLHVGVNPAAPSPGVPDRFRWRDVAAPTAGPPPEVTVMYQAGGYGALQVVGGTDAAVVIEMTGDNIGPPTAEEVATTWSMLRARLPGAALQAATLDDVAEVLRPVAPTLPVVTAEIGDTWIHGIASDPPKTAAFRETARRRRRWIEQGLAAPEEAAVWRASTELLLVAEHTWGLDQKMHWPEADHWSEQDLAAVRPRADTRRFEWSWSEQRSYLDRFMDVLERGGRADLAADARSGMLLTGAQPVSVVGLEPLVRPEGGGLLRVDLGGVAVALDPHDGSVVGLRAGDRELVEPGRAVGRVGHCTYDGEDYRRWFSTYNASVTPDDEVWALWDNTKPGLDRSAARSAWYVPDLVGAWAGRRPSDPTGAPGPDAATGETGATGAAHVLVVELSFPDQVRATSAAPPWVVLEYAVFDDRPDRLECSLQWVGKPAARWPESTWWSFAPAVDQPEAWRMVKVGEEVSPLDVVSRGARTLHAVERVQHPPSGTWLDLLDAPLVAPGRPALLRFDDELPDLSGGWHVCLYDNVWGTNFPMWCPGDARFRATLGWGGPEDAAQ